ncbi:MAG: OsmC family protein [Cyclobacteriaceae bacterium]|nr:OsmC family protein [Cyclobacteriaceae bacterium]
MATSKVEYLGQLSTKLTHLRSGKEIITDAPVDNNGKGQAFSPTDLVSTALCSCMMTLMGMYAERAEIDITSMTAEITKNMASNPRRIAEVIIEFDMSGITATEKERIKLERAALTCPVALSLSPELKQVVNFNY